MPKKKNKRYRVNVYYQYDVNVMVSAKNGREARKKAQDRVAKRKIGHKAIRKEYTDEECESDY